MSDSRTTSSAIPRRPRRRDAARQLLHVRQLKESLALSRQPSLRNATLAGLQAAITVAIALPMVYLSPWSHLIGFAALGALAALFGRFAPLQQRGRIVLLSGICLVSAVLGMSAAAWLGAPIILQLALLSLGCGLFLFICVSGGFGPPGPLIFIFAAGASIADGLAFEYVIERTLATALVAALAWVVCAVTESWRHYPPAPAQPLPQELRAPLKDRLTAAGRSAVGAAVAVFISYACGANHPAWAAMGALAVMQGAHLHISMNRALQRTAGTAVGALLAWAMLSQSPSVWSVIAALVVLQLATEIVIGINYGFGQILVTPMALLMTHLAMPLGAGPELAPERVFDTLVGAAVGMVFAVLLSSLDDRRYLARCRQGGSG